jgi:2-amino-4-hydroxy-6-hydroxymethyldihydropteridine diphosphokinase
MMIYLGLGSNLGHKNANIDNAIRKIEAVVGEVIRRSDYYVSAPWGFESEHDFVNVVICVETALQPFELLRQLQKIEKEMGREQKTAGGVYTDRIIDIDILLYEDLVLDSPELKVPHPLMKERDFVMKPLNEILG